MSSIDGKRIVVIGGSGWLGSAAVESASARGARVAILSRHAAGPNAIQGSITDPGAVRDAVRSAHGIVISVEASRTTDQLNVLYVEGTRNVLNAAPVDAHIVFMSHIGITDIQRMPEYNESKLKAEELIRHSGRPYTIVRPSWVVPGGTGVKLEWGRPLHRQGARRRPRRFGRRHRRRHRES